MGFVFYQHLNIDIKNINTGGWGISTQENKSILSLFF